MCVEEHARSKKKAKAFEDSKPHKFVLGARQSLGPIRRHTVCSLALMSEKEDEGQAQTEAMAIGIGAAAPQVGRRLFPLQRCARLELERTFVLETNAVLQEEVMWNDLIEDNAKTVEMNCVLYSLISGLQAGIEEYHIEPNLAMEIAMFAVDFDSESLEKVVGSM